MVTTTVFITPTFFITALVVAVVSYLLGSVNCAIIVSALFAGDDVRNHGSGSAGMTNMLRTYGKVPTILTALGDFLKAVVAVLLGRLAFYLMMLTPETGVFIDAGYIAGVSVIIGHMFPIYFKFKGGKGVMSTLGVMLVVNPLVFLILVVVFVPLVFIVKIVSLGSMLGAICYPFLTWLVLHLLGREPFYDTIGAAVMSLMILYMHRENIKRLLDGTENKFGSKPKQ